MKKVVAAVAMLFAVALILGNFTSAGEKKGKEETLKGTLQCGKCTCKITKACCNVLAVKEGKKTVLYFLKDKGKGEKYHKGICPPGNKKAATVTGDVSEKDGKKYIKPSKVEVE